MKLLRLFVILLSAPLLFSCAAKEDDGKTDHIYSNKVWIEGETYAMNQPRFKERDGHTTFTIIVTFTRLGHLHTLTFKFPKSKVGLNYFPLDRTVEGWSYSYDYYDPASEGMVNDNFSWSDSPVGDPEFNFGGFRIKRTDSGIIGDSGEYELMFGFSKLGGDYKGHCVHIDSPDNNN